MKTILLIMIGFSSFLTADFTRDANNIVTDSTTGLEWQDDSIGDKMNWIAAIDYCEGLTLGGHNDWRLPNINELISLVDDSKHNPSIDTNVFQNTSSENYWSSTTYAGDSGLSRTLFFEDGTQFHYLGKGLAYHVRCVRTGE